MKLFFFFIATLLIGSSTAQSSQSNITAEFQAIFNELNANADRFANELVAAMQGAARAARDALVASYTALKIFVAPFLSGEYLNILGAAVNVTANTLLEDTSAVFLLNTTAEYFSVARTIYRDAVSRYAQFFNSSLVLSSEIYQCWNATRPQIAQVFRTFINNTRVQSKPIIDTFKNTTATEYSKFNQNFTSYQRNTPICFILFKSCRDRKDQYVSELSVVRV
jgi:hypothetical protein